jgi:hypothetical protein
MFKAGSLLSLGAVALLAASSISSCGDSSNIGSSLIQDESAVVIANDFTITGHTVTSQKVQSRTNTQVLGRIMADGYGSFSSNFVAQLMPTSTLDTEGVTVNDIDSLKLLMYVTTGDFVGDSLVPMGLEVFRLNKALKAPMYTNEPISNYFSESDKLADCVYVCNALGQPDSIQALSYRLIEAKMPDQLARDFYTQYVNHPETFATPSAFAEYFPGICVRNSYGSGRVVTIASTLMRMYYHATEQDDDGNDTIVSYYGNYFAVTPEIMVNNNIEYQMDRELQARIDNGENIIVAPVGTDVEITLPLEELITYYKQNSGSLSVLNSLSLDIPVEKITNDYGIEPPENLLMVLRSQRDSFFKNGDLTDDETSFYAVYDSANKRYRFSGLRTYLLNMLAKSEITADDYTFILTPVDVESETSTSTYYYTTATTTTVTAINPYIGAPAMAKLDIDNAKLSMAFSTQTVR